MSVYLFLLFVLSWTLVCHLYIRFWPDKMWPCSNLAPSLALPRPSWIYVDWTSLKVWVKSKAILSRLLIPYTQLRMWIWTFGCSLEVRRCYGSSWYPNSNSDYRKLALSADFLLCCTMRYLHNEISICIWAYGLCLWMFVGGSRVLQSHILILKFRIWATESSCYLSIAFYYAASN